MQGNCLLQLLLPWSPRILNLSIYFLVITSFLALKGSSFNSLGQFTGHWTVSLEPQLCLWGTSLPTPADLPLPTLQLSLRDYR